jgi:hypothetical protein
MRRALGSSAGGYGGGSDMGGLGKAKGAMPRGAGKGGRATQEPARYDKAQEAAKPSSSAAARAKLAPELRDLPRKLAAAGTSTLRVGKLSIENGQVKVRVKLSDLSEQVLAELKKLGFQELSRSEAEQQVVGTIHVSRLEALALLEKVQRIEPAQ